MNSPGKLIDIDSSPTNLLNSPQPEDNVLNSINAISELRLPTYGVKNPRIWFAQVEALFLSRGIRSQATKYAYIVGALPIEVAAEVGDLIDNVPETDPYDKIKAAVIHRTSQSDEKRLQQLLTACELGDKRPSQLLRHMRQLAGSCKLDEALLKQMWSQRLPYSVRQILSVSGASVSLDDLADMADRMIEIYPDSRGIYAVQPASKDAMNPTLDMQHQIAHLTRQLASLQATISTIRSRCPRSRSRRRSLSRHRHWSPKRAAGMCWYHSNYGEKARRCTKPCSFTTSKSDHQGNEVARQ
ncbi:unnamed protein product [Schistosoma bovis]|nr:unnamed protein product [Schistosoma bovis]CAH8487296.1 unnamed protein product [Schistosoma bovis]